MHKMNHILYIVHIGLFISFLGACELTIKISLVINGSISFAS